MFGIFKKKDPMKEVQDENVAALEKRIGDINKRKAALSRDLTTAEIDHFAILDSMLDTMKEVSPAKYQSEKYMMDAMISPSPLDELND